MRRLALAFALLFAVSALAQQSAPPRMTWIRYYEIVPGKEADFIGMLRASNTVVDKLIAEKKVVAWGLVVPISQNGDPWTHAVYITLQDWAALENLINAAMADHVSRKPDERARLDAIVQAAIKPGSIRDIVLHHVSQSEALPAAKPKYIDVTTLSVKHDRFADAAALFNEWAKPVFIDVAAKGKLGPWGLSVQEETFIAGGWTHMVWSFLSDLTALDEVDASLATMGATKLRGFDIRLRDMSEPEKRRGQLLRIVHAVP